MNATSQVEKYKAQLVAGEGGGRLVDGVVGDTCGGARGRVRGGGLMDGAIGDVCRGERWDQGIF